MTQKQAQDAYDLIASSQHPIICIDLRLDYDAFGSALSMAHVIDTHFKITPRVTFAGTIPSDFRSIINAPEHIDLVEAEVDAAEVDFAEHDLIIYLDSGDIHHISHSRSFEPPTRLKVLNIDHHTASNDNYGTVNIVESAPATCSILFELYQQWGIEIDPTIGRLLLLGIYDDSGIFKYDKIRPKDFRIAADLLEMTGIESMDLVFDLTYHETPNLMRLRRLLLDNLVIDQEREVAYSTATLREYDQFGIDRTVKEIDSPVDEIRRIEGTRYAFFIKQDSTDSRAYKISLRSRLPDFNVAKIAERLGGGGHSMAAGARIADINSMKDAVQHVLQTAGEVYPDLAE